ncbi:MAG: hypothetical protein ACTHKU_01815, partial [Verrucomicrobiota bacterium]
MKLKRILFCFLFLFLWVVSVRAQTVRVDGSGNLVGAYSNFFSVNAQLWIKELVSRRYLTNGMALTNLSSLGGTNGQIPYANAAGGISWSNAPSGGGGGGNTVDGITNNQVGVALSGTFTGTGTGLSLDAGQLGTGTVPDARLAGSVVRSNNAGALSFTNANNQFTGQFTASGTNRAGLILNAMTTAQRTALGENAALDGALIYNTQKSALEYYTWGGGYGSRWSKLTPIDVFSPPLNLFQDLDGKQNILYMDRSSSISDGYLGAADFAKFNAAVATNDSRVLNLTNQLSRFAGSNYYVGPGLVLQTTTNAIAIFNSGNPVYDGVYARLSSTLYSNSVNGAILTFQNPTWYLQSASAVNQYSSSSLFSSSWTVVSGTAPGPGSGYAAAFNLNGVQFTGSWNSTNLNSLLQALTNSLGSAAFQARTAFQPSSATLTNLAATGAFTNGMAAGPGISFSTNSGVLTITSVSGSGTVTSVAITVPSDETVIGSPITSSGTIAISRNAQGANQFLAGPSSGGSAVPGYRAITVGDLPYTPAPSNYNGVVGALGFTPATNVVVTAPYRTNIVAWSDGFANLNNWRKIAPDSSFSIVGGKVRLGNYMDY